MKKFFVTFCLSAVALVATAQNEPYRNPNLSPSERAWDLLKRMTLEEKIRLTGYRTPRNTGV